MDMTELQLHHHHQTRTSCCKPHYPSNNKGGTSQALPCLGVYEQVKDFSLRNLKHVVGMLVFTADLDPGRGMLMLQNHQHADVLFSMFITRMHHHTYWITNIQNGTTYVVKGMIGHFRDRTTTE